MREILKISLFFYVVLALNVCESISTKEEKTAENSKSNVIVVPENVQKGDDNSLADIVRGIEIIPLQTLPESLLLEPHKIIMGNFIYYMARGGLWIFERDGTFKKKLRNGKGPGELSQLIDVQLDSNGDLLVLEYLNIKRFSPEGEFLSDFEIVPYETVGMAPNGFAWDNSDHYFLWESGGRHLEKRTDIPFYHIYEVGEGRKLLNNYQEIFSMTISVDRFVYSGGVYHITPALYDNTIYEINKGVVRPKYRIDFGSGNVNKSDLRQGFSHEIGFGNFKKMTGKSRAISNFMKLGDYIYFQFISHGQYLYAFYSEKSGQFYASSNQNAVFDDLLPFRIVSWDRNSNKALALSEPGTIFEHLSSNALELKETSLIDQEDLALLEQLEESDNPVLIRITLD